MGFLTRLKNFFTGRGFKDDEKDENIITEKEYSDVSDKQYKEFEFKDVESVTEEPSISEDIDTQDISSGLSRPDTEFDKIVKRVDKSRDYNLIVGKIKKDIVNKVFIPPNLESIGRFRPIYERLFNENAKLSDPEIMNILIENRSRLQHRFTGKVDVYLNSRFAGSLEIFGILAEQIDSIYQYLSIGQNIEYLAETLDAIGSFFNNEFGCLRYSVNVINNKGKITDINVISTFA